MMDKHGDFSPFAYCYNNPINLIDPFGLDTVPAGQVSFGDFNLQNDVIDFGNSSNYVEKSVFNQNKKYGNIDVGTDKLNANPELLSYSNLSDVLNFMRDITQEKIKMPQGAVAGDYFKQDGICPYKSCFQEFNYKETLVRATVCFSEQSKLTGIIVKRKQPNLEKTAYAWYEIYVKGTMIANEVSAYSPKLIKIKITGNNKDAVLDEFWNHINSTK